MIGIRRAGRGPGTKCARLINAFLKNLALRVFAVIHEFAGIDRLIELSF